jgi:hypothetical protein
MAQENGNGDSLRFAEILVSKLKDECQVVAALTLRIEKGEELNQEETELLVSWLPFLGKFGESVLHSLLSRFNGYDQKVLQEVIDLAKTNPDGFITCANLRKRWLCKGECRHLEGNDERWAPVLIFKEDKNLTDKFESIKHRGDHSIYTAKDAFVFRVANAAIQDDRVYTRIELIIDGQVINSDCRLNLSSQKSRRQFANKCVEMYAPKKIEAINIERCLHAMESLMRKRIQDLPRRNEPQDPVQTITAEERAEAMTVLMTLNPIKVVIQDIQRLGYVGEDPNIALIYLICLSRKLDKPLAAVITASSASGKNKLVGAVLEFVPREDKLVLSRVTQNALFYCAERGLAHKVLCIAERSGSEEADYSIRTLISEGRLAVYVPTKNEETGVIETQLVEVEGPVAYLETTTAARQNIENLTRLFRVFIDESEEQTARIHEIQRHERTLDALTTSLESDRIKKKHQNAQRLLEKVNVIIPYAPLITFPTHSVRSRRDHEKFLGLITTVAFVRQFQKTKRYVKDIAYIEADLADYKIAYQLSQVVLHQTMDEISRKSRELMVIIQDMVQQWYEDKSGALLDDKIGLRLTNIVFTRADVRRRAKGWSDASVHSCMKELGHYELLRIVSGGRQGQTYRYCLLSDEETTTPTISKLLPPDELASKLNEQSLRKVSKES